jgi:enoyl-CoA hydratase/carnithine racemase
MDILVSKAAGILTLEFKRPDRKNAITSAMYQTLADALNAAQGDSDVRSILIMGQPELFTAGNDLEDFMKTTRADDGVAFGDRPVFQFMRALSGSAKPVVAAVGGLAIGIGTTLLMHCDLVYAADSTKFSVPFTQLGLCPEFGSSLLMPVAGGHARAAEKLMLGEPFTAQEAYDMGIVSKVVAPIELLTHARAQAAKLAALPANSIRTTKRLMTSSRKAQLEEAIATESRLFGEMLQGAEAKEAFTAFFEKRKPDFTKCG